MLRIICLILALFLAFPSALAEMKSEPSSGITMILGDISGGYYTDVELFYKSGNNQELTAVSRNIYVPIGSTLVESALSELFVPADDHDFISTMPGDASIKSVNYSCGIVTVDLAINLAGLQSESELLSIMLSISNTLSGIDGVEYINILVNSRQEHICGLPTGLFSGNDTSMSAVWAKYQTENSSIADVGLLIKRQAALYYPSANGQWLLPDVRNITFETSNYAEQLIRELASGTQDSTVYSNFVAGGINILTDIPVISVDSSGVKYLDIKLSNTLRDYIVLQGIAEWQLAGAITLTMCSFIPEIDAVRITLGEEIINQLNIKGIHHEYEDGLLFRSDFDMYVGSISKLYFANENKKLSCVARSVSSERTLSAYSSIVQLISGPSSANTGLFPVMPAGIMSGDILGVAVNNGTATLNMTSNFYRLCQLMTESEERLLVYSIVNTLCELPGVKSVKILIEGDHIETLAGSIYLIGELLPNPGITE